MSTVNAGPTTFPLKSSRVGISPSMISHSNDSSNSPRVSEHSVTATVWISPTGMTPAAGSKEKSIAARVFGAGGISLNSAATSPRLTSSTSYWCTAPMNTSPTSRASYVNTAMGPTAWPLSVSGSRSSRPSTSTYATVDSRPLDCGWNLTVTSHSPPGTTSPASGTHVKCGCSKWRLSASNARSKPAVRVANSTALAPRISSSSSDESSSPSSPMVRLPATIARRRSSCDPPSVCVKLSPNEVTTRDRASSSRNESASFLTSNRTGTPEWFTTRNVRCDDLCMNVGSISTSPCAKPARISHPSPFSPTVIGARPSPSSTSSSPSYTPHASGRNPSRTCAHSPTSRIPSAGDTVNGSGANSANLAVLLPTLRTVLTTCPHCFTGVGSKSTESGKSSAGLLPAHRTGTMNFSRSVATTRSTA